MTKPEPINSQNRDRRSQEISVYLNSLKPSYEKSLFQMVKSTLDAAFIANPRAAVEPDQADLDRVLAFAKAHGFEIRELALNLTAYNKTSKIASATLSTGDKIFAPITGGVLLVDKQ